VPRASPVQLVRRMDCLHFLSAGCESGLAKGLIHDPDFTQMSRFVPNREKEAPLARF
jgi:hypothetical protein